MPNSKTSCAFTGHRPARFGFGDDEADAQCVRLKGVLEYQVEELIKSGVDTFYSGMALGVDQWAAEIVLEKKKTYPHIKLIAVLPFKTQADKWSEPRRERHFDTLALCDDVVTLNPRYTPACYFERNRYMVDRAEYLLAVYDGGSGGTANTIKYAKQSGRRITVIYPDTFEVKYEYAGE